MFMATKPLRCPLSSKPNTVIPNPLQTYTPNHANLSFEPSIIHPLVVDDCLSERTTVEHPQRAGVRIHVAHLRGSASRVVAAVEDRREPVGLTTYRAGVAVRATRGASTMATARRTLSGNGRAGRTRSNRVESWQGSLGVPRRSGVQARVNHRRLCHSLGIARGIVDTRR